MGNDNNNNGPGTGTAGGENSAATGGEKVGNSNNREHNGSGDEGDNDGSKPRNEDISNTKPKGGEKGNVMDGGEKGNAMDGSEKGDAMDVEKSKSNEMPPELQQVLGNPPLNILTDEAKKDYAKVVQVVTALKHHKKLSKGGDNVTNAWLACAGYVTNKNGTVDCPTLGSMVLNHLIKPPQNYNWAKPLGECHHVFRPGGAVHEFVAQNEMSDLTTDAVAKHMVKCGVWQQKQMAPEEDATPGMAKAAAVSQVGDDNNETKAGASATLNVAITSKDEDEETSWNPTYILKQKEMRYLRGPTEVQNVKRKAYSLFRHLVQTEHGKDAAKTLLSNARFGDKSGGTPWKRPADTTTDDWAGAMKDLFATMDEKEVERVFDSTLMKCHGSSDNGGMPWMRSRSHTRHG